MEVVREFSDLRPISLSSFTNKIISRVIHGRLMKVLPKIISQNQSVLSKVEILLRMSYLPKKLLGT